jgi:hypothetical protein
MLFVVASEMKLWVKPESSSARRVVSLSWRRITCLAGADPSVGVKGDERLHICHGVVARRVVLLLVIRVLQQEEALANLVMAALECLFTIVIEFEAVSFLHLDRGQVLDLVALHCDRRRC